MLKDAGQIHMTGVSIFTTVGYHRFYCKHDRGLLVVSMLITNEDGLVNYLTVQITTSTVVTIPFHITSINPVHLGSTTYFIGKNVSCSWPYCMYCKYLHNDNRTL